MIKMIFLNLIFFIFLLFYQNWAVIAHEWILLNLMTHLKNSPHKNAIFDVKKLFKKKVTKVENQRFLTKNTLVLLIMFIPY